MTTGDADVIVVGAGIAGLAAAHRSSRSGSRVLVLEASDRVGGRMTSDRVEGGVVDRGAQFLSSGYRTLLPLIGEAGLSRSLTDVGPWGAVVRGGRPRRIRAGHPLSLLRSGLLGIRDLARIAWTGRELRHVLGAPLDDYSAWAAWDDEDAERWCRRAWGDDVADYVVEAAMQGFYFQPLEGTSRALALVLIAFDLSKGRVTTLADGLGSLPEALAARLDVRLSAPVGEVREREGSVEVRTNGETFHARHVILATPATTARRLFPEATGVERELLATTYSSTVMAAFASDRRWGDAPGLDGVYGLLVPARERDCIAGVGIESGKYPRIAETGEILNVMLDGRSGAELVDAPDEAIVRRVLPELGRHFPGVARTIRFVHVVRWKEAEPTSPVGRARAIARYRNELPRRKRVLLAGDYMGMPFTDGAAATGIWAAERVLAG